jgi:hypothetical protein
MITSSRTLDLVWILLIALTLGGVAIGEGAEPGFWITVIVAAITAFKGRMVIDYFIEVGDAHPGIRRLVRIYGFLVPLLMILIYLYGPQIAQLTSL